ncbi:hypothetical protein Rsub_10901 [Raphidocelis subcapitata]|uniref:Glycerophosphocholine acyltransferase 1 n=1 Tax=Raphidocelis subcapitata TaxID=307507 RepID=A0A2V0PK88_9CHLO|nr:hypothetical protein Rsub_10901 [Raphidocelis subcapitata]|eukprot:GBF97737.1 hypothetical protein Rsub_10901 [Raphidocelis subcapitata]
MTAGEIEPSPASQTPDVNPSGGDGGGGIAAPRPLAPPSPAAPAGVLAGGDLLHGALDALQGFAEAVADPYALAGGRDAAALAASPSAPAAAARPPAAAEAEGPAPTASAPPPPAGEGGALQREPGGREPQQPPIDAERAPRGGGGEAGAAEPPLGRTAAAPAGTGAAPDESAIGDSVGEADDLDYSRFEVGDIGPLLARPLPLPPHAVLLRDKAAFCLGLALTWVVAYWLGCCPSTFYRLHTALAAALLAVRWAVYRSKRWHYFMFDLCYFANALLLAHCWLAPHSAALGRVTFALDTGPLLWSVVAFRNSLVLHSLDKVTSVYLHVAPALVSWALLWHPDAARFAPAAAVPPHPPAPPAAAAAWPGSCAAAAAAGPLEAPAPLVSPAGPLALVALAMPAYAVWAAAYYCKVFVLSADKIRRLGYATLFTWVADPSKKGVYAAIARAVPPALRPPVYFALHGAYTAATVAASAAAARSRGLHTALLAGVCAASAWHGASYYFEFFARRYASELEARRAAHAAAAAAAGGGKGGGGTDGRRRGGGR